MVEESLDSRFRDSRNRSCGLAGARAHRADISGNVRRESGQSLLEVALVTPLVLALALGAIELGRYAYVAILVSGAARAGAAYGGQNLVQSVDAAGIRQAADNDFQNNGQNVSKLIVSSTASCGCDSNGTITSASCNAQTNANAGSCNTGHWVVMVTVEAKGTFNSLFNYPGLPKSITVDRTATLRVVQQ
jgi:Flp pilus assembly protein TadG